MRPLTRLWHITAGAFCALGLYVTNAAANSYDQVELHSGSSSGPVWSGGTVFNGTSAGFIFTMSILQITCHLSTGAGTVNSADVGNITSIVYQQTATTVGCPGSGNTTWTILPVLPWSLHQLYDQTTNQFVTILDKYKLQLITGATTCLYVGANSSFADIAQGSTILGSQTNPGASNPGAMAFGFGSTGMNRISGNTLLCPATQPFQGSYNEQGQRSNGSLFNIWQRNQGTRIQG
jgi:hypothetical protein